MLSLVLEQTWAVLIGASKFLRDEKNLPPLPSVKNNINDLAQLLADSQIIGIPKGNIISILDEHIASRVAEQLAEVARKAEDTLIIYYAGHGLIGRTPGVESQLLLAVGETTDANAAYNALKFEDVHNAILESPARKKVLILDCCFSGRAIPQMGNETNILRASIDIEGTCTLASTPANKTAMAPEGEKYTTFSGKLIQALQEGIENQRKEITIADLYDHIRTELLRRGIPEPQKLFLQDADKIVIALNRKPYIPPSDLAIVEPDVELPTLPLATPDEISKHCMEVVKSLIRGRLSFFLGWDINLYGRQTELAWQPDQFNFLPNIGEVTTYLSKKYNYPLINEQQNFSRVSQSIVDQVGFDVFCAELKNLYLIGKHYSPTPLHHFLAKLPDLLANRGYSPSYPLIITTNYDDGLERTFRENNQPFDLVYYVAKGEERGKFVHCSPNGVARLIQKPEEDIDISFEQQSVILKICGTVTPTETKLNGFVIGEDFAYLDYIDSRNLPISLVHKLYKGNVLFLGCCSRDWNLRNFLRRLSGDYLKDKPSWWIEPNPRILDTQWLKSYHVEVFSAPLEKYLTELVNQLELQTLPLVSEVDGDS